MPKEKVPFETLSVKKAIQCINDMCIQNTDRIKKLQQQHDELLINITQKHEELETRIINIQSQISDICMKTTSNLAENQQNFNEIKQRCNEIVKTLFSFSEHSEPKNINHDEKMANTPTTSIVPVLNMVVDPDDSSKTAPSLSKNAIQVSKPHSIMVLSPRTIPIFSGKHSENPKQFLIRVEEYAETVYGWDQVTLLRGISQFLKGAALDWYCQLKAFCRHPQRWVEFVTTFLSQFNSPMRIIRNEHKWYECKQLENETLNEFLIRLRALWSEHRKKKLNLIW